MIESIQRLQTQFDITTAPGPQCYTVRLMSKENGKMVAVVYGDYADQAYDRATHLLEDFNAGQREQQLADDVERLQQEVKKLQSMVADGERRNRVLIEERQARSKPVKQKRLPRKTASPVEPVGQ